MPFDRKIFFDLYRRDFDADGKLTAQQVQDLTTFLNLYEQYESWFNTAQWAYVFATAYHETAATMAPVREAFRMSEAWRKANLRYWPHYGRGYVQITWKENYEKFTIILKRDLNITIRQRDDFMLPNVAFYTMIYGFNHGSFTGKKLSDYVTPSGVEGQHLSNSPTGGLRGLYFSARRCINATDRAELIADHAIKFLNILNQSIQ
jgi:hypothetical protein